MMDIDFYECIQCQTIHLIPTSNNGVENYVCAHCQSQEFRKISKKFIVHCPVCLEYFSKRILRLVIQEGICECLKTDCEGLLTIRKEWGETEDILQSTPQNDQPDTSSGLPNLVPFPKAQPIDELPIPIPTQSPSPNSIPSPIPPSTNTQYELDGSLDLSAISSNLTKTELDKFMIKVRTSSNLNQLLSNKELEEILTGMLVSTLDSIPNVVEEYVQFVFYVGDLRGDLSQLLVLLNYFVPLIETFPVSKIVFLGNYLGNSLESLNLLAILSLLYQKYPENIILLRGSADVKEEIDRSEIARTIIESGNIPEKAELHQNLKHIYKLILHIFSQLPLVHISLMNQGVIAIYASNSGIPINILNPNETLLIREIEINQPPALSQAEMDEYCKHILYGRPNGQLKTLFEPDEKEITSYFGQAAFTNFLQANNLHYMVNANDMIKEGVKYQFNYNLCCTISSLSKFKAQKGSATETFNGKILRLVPGQTPIEIPVDKTTLSNDLKNSFGI
jgi:hypothetical protein